MFYKFLIKYRLHIYHKFVKIMHEEFLPLKNFLTSKVLYMLIYHVNRACFCPDRKDVYRTCFCPDREYVHRACYCPDRKDVNRTCSVQIEKTLIALVLSRSKRSSRVRRKASPSSWRTPSWTSASRTTPPSSSACLRVRNTHKKRIYTEE